MTSPTVIEHTELCRPAVGTASVFDRANSMADDVVEIIGEKQIDRIVIESPAVHANCRADGTGFGLAVYGFAAGIITGRVSRVFPLQYMVIVPADKWVPKRTTKTKRQLAVAAEFPAYRKIMDADKDPGKDIADAIGLGQWWWAQQRIERLEQAEHGKCKTLVEPYE